GCSAEAIQNAVTEGHLAVVHWLHLHYPEHAIDEWAGNTQLFEIRWRVYAVLQHQRDFYALHHVSTLISSVFGPPPCLSINHACSFGSTKLLDWIWYSSCLSAADRPSTWSLYNYLRSDLHYNRDQFQRSLEVAVRHKDLAVVEWLFAHIPGLDVPPEVVKSAASAGNLPILQFLLANDANVEGKDRKSLKKRKVVANDGEIKAEKKQPSAPGGGHVVHWSADVMMHWRLMTSTLYSGYMKICPTETLREIDRKIRTSLGKGDLEVAEILMPKGKCVLDYASCASVATIEMLLGCGYIKRDQDLANLTIENLALLGRVDLMQQI
ncbi:hypothetical protein GN958_ATG18693, partial [Phytophthora infestans]